MQFQIGKEYKKQIHRHYKALDQKVKRWMPQTVSHQ